MADSEEDALDPLKEFERPIYDAYRALQNDEDPAAIAAYVEHARRMLGLLDELAADEVAQEIDDLRFFMAALGEALDPLGSGNLCFELKSRGGRRAEPWQKSRQRALKGAEAAARAEDLLAGKYSKRGERKRAIYEAGKSVDRDKTFVEDWLSTLRKYRR